ncbi:MAG TPA: response regulator, partial [Alphaproteobacteria bacterium]|nr:response regulator [Alphaproteobacteria bacterium]
AERQAAGRPFDAAVIDLRLPDMDGVSLGQSVLDHPELARTGLVLLTAHDEGGQRRQSLAAGFSAYLSKPVRRIGLLRSVAAAAGRQTQSAAAPADAAVAGGQPAPSIAEARRAGTLILVAEDNATNRAVLRRQLARLGYAAELVPDGAAAFDAWRNESYGLILTDCHMPEMDGLELAQAIRQAERGGTRRIPIVALTANAMQGEAERCLAAGMDAFLAKPVSLGQLGEVLRRWMPDAAGAPAAALEAEDEAPPVETGADGGDVLRLADLDENTGGIDEELRGILDLFLDSTEPLLAELRRAILDRRGEDARRAAHSVKGAALTAGARELGELCAAIEASLKQGDWSPAERLAPEIEPAFARVTRAIARL